MSSRRLLAGTGPNENLGNIRFRMIVHQQLDEVVDGAKLSKVKLARRVVEIIKSRKGRFLRKLAKEEAKSLRSPQMLPAESLSHDLYKVVPDSLAVDKSKQSMRFQKEKILAARGKKHQTRRTSNPCEPEQSRRMANTNAIPQARPRDPDLFVATTTLGNKQQQDSARKVLTANDPHPASSNLSGKPSYSNPVVFQTLAAAGVPPSMEHLLSAGRFSTAAGVGRMAPPLTTNNESFLSLFSPSTNRLSAETLLRARALDELTLLLQFGEGQQPEGQRAGPILGAFPQQHYIHRH